MPCCSDQAGTRHEPAHGPPQPGENISASWTTGTPHRQGACPQGHTCSGGAAVLALLRVQEHRAREAEDISSQPLSCKGSSYSLTEWPSAQHSTPTSRKKTQQNRAREKIWGLPNADPPMHRFPGEPSYLPLQPATSARLSPSTSSG